MAQCTKFSFNFLSNLPLPTVWLLDNRDTFAELQTLLVFSFGFIFIYILFATGSSELPDWSEKEINAAKQGKRYRQFFALKTFNKIP